MSLLIKDVLLETGYEYDRETVIATMTETKDILIEDGFFTKIEAEIEIEPEMTVIDARGQLLLPAFKEMHTHLDKTYFGGDWQAVKATPNGIFSRMEEEASLLPEQYATVEERAHQLIRHYIEEGHTHIRTHVNVDPVMKE